MAEIHVCEQKFNQSTCLNLIVKTFENILEKDMIYLQESIYRLTNKLSIPQALISSGNTCLFSKRFVSIRSPTIIHQLMLKKP